MDHSLDSMCMTWRHDFGLLSDYDKNIIRNQLRQLHEHHVKPLLPNQKSFDLTCRMVHVLQLAHYHIKTGQGLSNEVLLSEIKSALSLVIDESNAPVDRAGERS